MIKRLLAGALLLASTFSFAEQKEDQSLLWEITGNGLKNPSYLYGTMHVSNKIAFHLGDTFFNALDNAEIIALESDPGKWMEEMFASRAAMSMTGYRKYLNFGSDKNFYEKISSVESPDKKTLTNALRDKHALQNGFLYRGSMFEDEYEESTYLDLFIYQYGKKNKKKVVALEDHEETNILQIKSMIPDPKGTEEEEKQKKKKRKNYYSKWNEDMTVREALEEAYRNGHVNVIDSIMKLTSNSDNYMKYFLFERNRIMAEGMDSLMKKHNIFVGIGAAHLAGEEGVIQMIKDKGYNVRPVKRNITKFAKDKKNDIEEFFLPVPFKKQTTKDGFISCSIPGPLYETPGESGDLQYFYPEMTNGGYFFIRRFSTFSPIHGEKDQDWIDKVDSLLFENIEGKILEEKEVKVSGFNAKDILNKTRKGDYQRRLIVYTPLEIIFFKMSGTGEWVKDYGNKFFNTISINDTQKKETVYRGHLNDYSITFPTAPIHNVHAEKLTEAPRHIVQSFDVRDSSYFALFNSSVTDYRYIEEDSFEVAFLCRTFYDQIDSAKIDTVYLTDERGKVAYGKGTLEGKTIFTKAFLHRHFYFLLVAKGTEEQANKYFDSFQYDGKFIEEEYKTYHDTVLHYTVNTPVAPEAMEDILFSVRQIRRRHDDNDWEYQRASRYFDNENTKESIYVNFYKFSDYYTKKDIDAFWKDELSSYKKNKLIMEKKEFDNNDTIQTVHMVMSDTNSTKRIEVKKFLNHGVIYTIKASYDSLAPRSKFVDTFFSSFMPTRDTLMGKEVTVSAANLFFDDLRSKDSLRMKKAVEMVGKIIFKDEHVDSILHYIKNYEFPEDDEEGTKVYLIRELGYVKSNRVAGILEQLYEDADGNYEEQFAALKGLANIRTKSSFKTMQKLLINTPPIASSSSNVRYLFNYFDDSLQLSKKLYPRAWDLMLYNKYRVPVYKLSTMMLDSGLIKAKSYKHMKPLILREAKSLTQEKSKYSSRMSLDGTDYFYRHGERIDVKEMLVEQYSASKYMKLLAPFYKKDKAVQKFFNKIFQSDNNKNRLMASIILSKNNISVPDSVLSVLSKDETYAYPFYRDLELIGKEKLFNDSSFSQENMAKSIIYAGDRSLDPEEDSVSFVKKVEFKEAKNKGYIYFFKSESSYGNKWYLHYAGVQPFDSTKVETDIDFDFIDRDITVYNEKDIDEEIEEVIKELYLRDRKRAKKYRYDY